MPARPMGERGRGDHRRLQRAKLQAAPAAAVARTGATRNGSGNRRDAMDAAYRTPLLDLFRREKCRTTCAFSPRGASWRRARTSRSRSHAPCDR
jgi:hypothetical protein